MPQWLDQAGMGDDTCSMNGSLYSSIHLGSKFQTPRVDIGSMSSVPLVPPLKQSIAVNRPSPIKSTASARNTLPSTLQRTPRRNSLTASNLNNNCELSNWDEMESQASTVAMSPNKASY